MEKQTKKQTCPPPPFFMGEGMKGEIINMEEMEGEKEKREMHMRLGEAKRKEGRMGILSSKEEEESKRW